jgi:hypothetical protein
LSGTQEQGIDSLNVSFWCAQFLRPLRTTPRHEHLKLWLDLFAPKMNTDGKQLRFDEALYLLRP